MKHLVIYFIATSRYKRGFISFKESLKYFFPEMRKTVIILSDGLENWNNKEEFDITYKVFHVDHFYWPIITLFKMKYILDHRQDCDFVCYFNADLQFNPDYKTPLSKILDLTKLNLTRHGWHYDDTLYDGSIFANNINEESLAFISHEYTYVQACFFFGPKEIVYKMCKDVSNWVKLDLMKNIIPQWHDESYLNKWCEENKELCAEKRALINGWNRGFSDDFPFALIKTFTKDRKTY